ncbi:hypothetical protein GSI_01796 [Ganoderma sinense ZZ0214-1]|uniref:Protein kinase domain-containing protein n=1 Tax=Ganoderma sinense ZZ0214-1 TaxID=1077348 RepID=A0A2G8SQT9_9APHY|nr:hypothetical protein GSI_01796 [Ganoderma sinense ZZ0214-1]
MNNRMAFIDFCQGLLNMNPIERWSPQQARLHPFITGEKWTKPWTPTGAGSSQSSSPSGQSSSGGSGGSAVDPKRPYGGLVPSQPKGTRAYQDAAAYNQHLAQHQAYTAQAQAASQAAQNVYRNPYLQPQTSQSQSASYSSGSQDSTGPNFPAPQQFPPAPSQTSSHRTLTHQSSHGHLNVSSNAAPFYPGQSTAGPGPGPGPGGFAVAPHMNPTAPGQSYYSSARTRSNTIHNMADNIPPALARLQHMNQDVIGGRKALTPVLKRDDAMKEWERRQQGKAAAAAQSYPHLEQLQQQAELAAAQGLTNWGHGSGRYLPPSGLAHSYQPNAMLVDEDRRDVILSNARNAAHGTGGADPASNLFTSSSANIIPSPPQAYASNSTTTGNRYAATYPQQNQQAVAAAAAATNSPFDGTMDRRSDLGVMYVPLQPDQYGPYNPASGAGAGTAPRQVVPPQQAVPTSFYGAGVVPAGHALGNTQQRNPFTGTDGQPQPTAKDQRRKSGMELWTQ